MKAPGHFALEDGAWVIGYPDTGSQKLVTGLDIHVVMDGAWRIGAYFVVEEWPGDGDGYRGPALVTFNHYLVQRMPDLKIGQGVMLFHTSGGYKMYLSICMILSFEQVTFVICSIMTS